MANVYHALDSAKKQFRTLELYKGGSKDRVKCSSRIVSFESFPAPEYETVSYCWGDSKKRASIEVDGTQLDVPASSEAVLRRLRLKDRNRVVWIDAVNINQGDVEERGQQVAMMPEIYRRSKANLIYLGEADGPLRKALKSVEAVLKQARKETYDFKTLKSVLHDRDRSILTYLAADDPLPRLDICSLEWLYTRPWFRGDRVFDLLDITRAAIWVALKKETAKFNFNMVIFAPPIHIFNMIDKEHGARSLPHPQAYATFGDLLRQFSMRYEVTDQRDAVYALTGLIPTLDVPPALIMDMIRPDYTKSLWETLQNGTRYALFQSRELTLLRTIKHPGDDGEVPEGRASWLIPAVRGSQDGVDTVIEMKLFVRPFDCCSSRPLDQTLLANPLHDDLSILSLKGVDADTVARTTPVFHRFMFQPDGHQSFIAQFKTVINLLAPGADIASLPIPIRRHDIVKTLMAGANKDNEPATSSYIDFITYTIIDRLVDDTPSTGADAMSMKKIQSPYTAEAPHIPALLRACKARRFFITRSGYIGLGPRGMRTGDTVAILYGGPEPFILRRQDAAGGDHYTFVGQAYVHEMMDGLELEVKLAGQAWQSKVFHIRRKTRAGAAYSYIVHLSGVSTFLIWVFISFIHICFRRAWAAQGHHASAPFRYPWNAYFRLAANVFLAFIEGWMTLAPFDAGNFVGAYILLPLFAVIFVAYKFFYKTKYWKVHETHLDSERKVDLGVLVEAEYI